MLPTAALSDQVTAVFVVFATIAVKAWVCEGVRLTLSGVKVTLTAGVSETVACAETAGLATLVAVTVTVWAVVMVAGAV